MCGYRGDIMCRRIVLCLVLLLFAGGCGGDDRVGSEDTLDFDTTEQTGRLGDETPAPAPDATTAPQADEATPAPTAAAAAVTTPKAAPVQYFDVSLIEDSPYFSPGNSLTMPIGVTLRVTNDDTTPERPTRSFTAEDGSFDSGPLKPGEVWTHTFTATGTWRVVDSVASYIIATIEVR